MKRASRTIPAGRILIDAFVCLLLVVLTPCFLKAQVLTRSDLHPKMKLKASLFAAFAPAPPNPSEFSISLSSRNVIVNQGDNASVTVTITAGSAFTGSVALNVMGLPAKMSQQFDMPTVALSGGQSADAHLTLTVDPSTPPGNTMISITGTSGAIMEAAVLNLGINPPTADFFSQGTVLLSSSDLQKPSVAVQAIDADFQAFLIHLRATLPTSSTTPSNGTSIYTTPNENLRAQLLDAFGGILNFAVAREWNQVSHLSNLSFDFRGAGKIIEVPKDPNSSDTEAYTASFAGAFNSNAKWVLFGNANGHTATFTLAGSYFAQVLADSSVAQRFTTHLSQWTHNANGGLVFNIPDLHFYVTAGYRWSNDSQVGHQYIFSISPAK